MPVGGPLTKFVRDKAQLEPSASTKWRAGRGVAPAGGPRFLGALEAWTMTPATMPAKGALLCLPTLTARRLPQRSSAAAQTRKGARGRASGGFRPVSLIPGDADCYSRSPCLRASPLRGYFAFSSSMRSGWPGNLFIIALAGCHFESPSRHTTCGRLRSAVFYCVIPMARTPAGLQGPPPA